METTLLIVAFVLACGVDVWYRVKIDPSPTYTWADWSDAKKGLWALVAWWVVIFLGWGGVLVNGLVHLGPTKGGLSSAVVLGLYLSKVGVSLYLWCGHYRSILRTVNSGGGWLIAYHQWVGVAIGSIVIGSVAMLGTMYLAYPYLVKALVWIP